MDQTPTSRRANRVTRCQPLAFALNTRHRQRRHRYWSTPPSSQMNCSDRDPQPSHGSAAIRPPRSSTRRPALAGPRSLPGSRRSYSWPLQWVDIMPALPAQRVPGPTRAGNAGISVTRTGCSAGTAFSSGPAQTAPGQPRRSPRRALPTRRAEAELRSIRQARGLPDGMPVNLQLRFEMPDAASAETRRAVLTGGPARAVFRTVQSDPAVARTLVRWRMVQSPVCGTAPGARSRPRRTLPICSSPQRATELEPPVHLKCQARRRSRPARAAANDQL